MPSTEQSTDVRTPAAPTIGKWVLVVLALFVLLGIARELGVIGVELYSSSSAKEHRMVLEGQQSLSGRELRIEYVDGERRDVHLVGGSGEPLAVTLRLARYDLSGWTRTPLFKRAKVAFEVAITTSDPAISGSLVGSIETASQGLITHRVFCERMREDVRAYVLRALTP